VKLTIAYMTNRREPMIEWFIDSLYREFQGQREFQLVVVDYWHGKRPLRIDCFCTVVTPKPCVYQGPHRFTKQDYFAAANARNTAICLARGEWIVFVDDLSVLIPGWLNAVREAIAGGYIACGAYRKVKNLVVKNGDVVSYTPFPPGEDTRRPDGPAPRPCGGDWLYGCSVAAPLEAFLKINGFDERCDSLGSEDYIAGMMLRHHGFHLKYDVRMMTYESEELHHKEKAFPRFDKGVSPNDKSHRIIELVRNSGDAPNFFGAGGIRGLRERVLAGEPFPIPTEPTTDWFDGQPLKEL
jgi:hypothetical protein